MTTRTGILVICVALAAFGGGFVAARATSHTSPPAVVEVSVPAPALLPPTQPASTVDVIVAAKDLPLGTLITKDDLPRFIKFRKVAKDALSPLFVQTEEELVGRRLARTLRVDEFFNPNDLKTGPEALALNLPKGMDVMSVALRFPKPWLASSFPAVESISFRRRR